MPKAIMARTGRHTQRLIYGSSAALTALILLGSLLLLRSALDQYRQREVPGFVGSTQEIGKFVDQLSAQLIQFADIYEGIRQFSPAPAAESSPRSPRSPDAGSVEPNDGLIGGASVVIDESRRVDRVRYNESIEIAKEFSAAPIVTAHRNDRQHSAYVYDVDGSFLAAFPPLDNAERTLLRQGSGPFIRSFMLGVENEAAKIRGPMELREGSRPIWIVSALSKGAIAQMAMPIYRAGERRFMIVVNLLAEASRKLAMPPPAERPGYFLLQADTHSLIGGQPQTPRSVYLLAKVRSNLDRVDAAKEIPSTFRVGQYSFITQRIAGPNWIAVYVYGWPEVLQGIREQVTIGLMLWLSVIAGIWVMAFYVDRRVSRPLFHVAERLVESQMFARAIIDTLPIGIAVLSERSGALLLDNEAARLIARSYGGVNSKALYDAIEGLRQGERQSGIAHGYDELTWQSAAEDPMYLGITHASTRLQGEPVRLIGLADISQRKKNEQLLLQSKVQAEEASRAKSLFVAVVGHEIRTPLHGAVGYLELLADSTLTNDQSEWLAIARQSFASMSSLLDDLLDYTKIESGSLSIRPGPTCVNDVVEACAKGFQAVVAKAGLGLACCTDPGLDGDCQLDAQRLTQVINNLIGNSLRFTTAGGISIRSALLRPPNQESMIRIEVEDTGTGIDADSQSSIFQPMYQGSPAPSARHQGTGLGLFICSTLCRLMGGGISVTSESGRGSIFTVTLPFLPLAPAVARPPVPGLSVAVLGDDAALVEAIQHRTRAWLAVPRENANVVDVTVVALTCVSTMEHWQGKVSHAMPIIWLLPAGPQKPVMTSDGYTASALARESLYLALADCDGQRVSDVTDFKPSGDLRVNRKSGEDPIALSVLVVEDDPVSRSLLVQQLKMLGVKHVNVAIDGEDGWSLWRRDPCDIIITDLNMPRLDGLGLAIRVRSTKHATFIVATTAAADLPDEQGLFDNVLRKPVVIDDLRRVLPQSNVGFSDSAEPVQRSAFSIDYERDMIRLMRSTWQSDGMRIRDALASSDYPVLRRRIHRLKGALLSLGWNDLVADLDTLDQAADIISINEALSIYDPFVLRLEERLE